MSHFISTPSKFLGITSLGLLSGSALTLSLSTLPSLLALPDPSLALPAFWKLKQHTAAAHGILSLSASALLALAFGVSPRAARHPYLLWTVLTVGLGELAVPRLVGGRDVGVLDEEEVQLELAEEGRGRSGKGGEVRVNGEVVREGMGAWARVLGWKSVVWGLGWGMGLVGIWGEGAGVVARF